jgi:hypothetical protein
MSDINNEKSYEELFSSKIVEGVKWREEALKNALDIRKFEIDLYWKRAAYFWTLIAASFGGYFALQNGGKNENGPSIFIITCIGLILSFAWYLVNRGSKYWQENWERHVDVLSEKVIGPLYRTTLSRGQWFTVFMPHEAFPFSVSRVNQLVSLFVTLLWVGLAIRAFPMSHAMRPSQTASYCIMAGFTVAFLFLILLFGWPKKRHTRRRIHFDVADFDEKEAKGTNTTMSPVSTRKPS